MSITWNETTKQFRLDAGNCSYVIGVFDEDQYLCHLYYGPKVPDTDLSHLYGEVNTKAPSGLNGQRGHTMQMMPFEYSAYGTGDFRDPALEVQSADGYNTCSLFYQSHKIYSGKPVLEGLPSTFEKPEDWGAVMTGANPGPSDGTCTTLEILTRDAVLGLDVILTYTTFEDLNVITRTVTIVNGGEQTVYLKKVLSASVDFYGQDYDALTLHGSWARECQPCRLPVKPGKIVTGDSRGITSPASSPLIALMSKDTNEDHGEVFAMNLVYSGNFYGCVEGCETKGTRMDLGINPQNFTWKLEPGEHFQAPEAVLVYSAEGLGGMTRTFHDLYRDHLIHDPYGDTSHPILVNNWEATYMDFNTDKLLEIARAAADCGIEMLVLDDGWFGNRGPDDRGLGDWIVNEEKLPGGLTYLAEEVNKLGLKQGLWIEPEMVNPNSDLYRAHPDWILQVPGRTPSEMRWQYILDWSRKDVRDYIYDMIYKVLKSANIEYVKWDMNRTMTEIGSASLPASQQQEVAHRYVLGVYEFMGRLVKDFPNLLLENCSSGGSRFDAGMLYYSPQIWTSDDTDAIERIYIQAGTSLAYPITTMGAHVSASPNHQCGRITPLDTRGMVAMAGTFGYELDVAAMTDEEKALVREQCEMYHKYNMLMRKGDLYRLNNVYEDPDHAAWAVVAKDKSEALVTYIQIHNHPDAYDGAYLLKVKGLDPDALYEVEGQNLTLSGAALMNGGLWMDWVWMDYAGRQIHLVRK